MIETHKAHCFLQEFQSAGNGFLRSRGISGPPVESDAEIRSTLWILNSGEYDDENVQTDALHSDIYLRGLRPGCDFGVSLIQRISRARPAYRQFHRHQCAFGH